MALRSCSTRTLSHLIVGVLGGVLWVTFGAQYIFYTVAALSLVNLYVAVVVKESRRQEHIITEDVLALEAANREE